MKRRWILLLGGALAGAALDVATKSLVFSRLLVGETVPVLPRLLSFQPTLNAGIAWGFFPSRAWAAVSVIAVPVIAALFLRAGVTRGRDRAAGALLLAGALGNGWDRVILGQVRDFILIAPIPNFNLADLMLNVGIAILVLGGLWHESRPVGDARPAPPREPHDGGLGDLGRDHGPGS